MLGKLSLKILSRVIVRVLRAVFRLPNRIIATIFFGAYKLALFMRAPDEGVSYLEDAYRAMRDGPPLSISLRNIVLKSDPLMMEDLLFNAMRGDRQLEDTDPWS